MGALSFAEAQDYSISNSKAIKSYENALTAINSRKPELALSFLDEAIEREPDFIETYLLMFEVYTELRDFEKAEQALEKAVAMNPDFFPNAWFFLGMLEMNAAKYAEAIPHFNTFKSYPGTNPNMTEQAEKHLANAAFGIEAMKNPVDFEPVNMGEAINTGQPEYFPGISADGGIFIFTRLMDDGGIYGGKNEDFFISRNRMDTWFPSTPLHGVNSSFNEGAPTLSSDARTLVFTGCEVNGIYGEGRKGYGSCDLFISENIGGKWQPPQNFGAPVNSALWESQPSLSADGNTLYFIRGKSQRGGKVEYQDIFVAKKQSDGSWSKPEKVSDKINTPDREESVHVHPDGRTLYFSSNGHIGMGGLDLFLSRMDENGEWQEPVNLGYPINTQRDENSILINASGDLAYYASNREGGFGDLDLYSFVLPKSIRPNAVAFTRGRVIDGDTGEPLEASIELVSLSDTPEGLSFGSDSQNGEFLVALTAKNPYAVTVKKKGYLIHSENFELASRRAADGYDLEVKLFKVRAGSSVVLKNVFFDLDKDLLKTQSTPELSALATFMRENPEVRIELGGHTDNQGQDAYNKELSKRRAAAVKDYLVTKENIPAGRLETKGYGATSPISDNATEEGRARNRRTEVKIL